MSKEFRHVCSLGGHELVGYDGDECPVCFLLCEVGIMTAEANKITKERDIALENVRLRLASIIGA